MEIKLSENVRIINLARGHSMTHFSNGTIKPQYLNESYDNAIFLFMKVSRWQIPGIDVFSIPGICQSARKFPGIDFFMKRSFPAPVRNTFSFTVG